MKVVWAEILPYSASSAAFSDTQDFQVVSLEAGSGIEPLWTDLQSVA
jgi:hypothetical protein